MKLHLYTLHDDKLEAYGQIMTYTAHGQAMREFTDQVNSKDSPLNKHPEDYTLVYLGEYDNQSGAINTPPQPLPKATASQVIITTGD